MDMDRDVAGSINVNEAGEDQQVDIEVFILLEKGVVQYRDTEAGLGPICTSDRKGDSSLEKREIDFTCSGLC